MASFRLPAAAQGARSWAGAILSESGPLRGLLLRIDPNQIMIIAMLATSLPDMAPTYDFTVLGLMVVFSVAGVALSRWIVRRMRSKKG